MRNEKYIRKDGKWNNQQTLTINNPIWDADYKAKKATRHQAQRELSGDGFIMWFELADNKDEFPWLMSMAYFRDECGMSERAYYRAKQELEDKGYIVWTVKNDKGIGILGYFNVLGKHSGDVGAAREPKQEEPETKQEQTSEPETDWDRLMLSSTKKTTKDGTQLTFKQFEKKWNKWGWGKITIIDNMPKKNEQTYQNFMIKMWNEL